MASLSDETRSRNPRNERAHKQPVNMPEKGCGGVQHRSLQNLVRDIAEECGYRTTIDKLVFDGEGSVDVEIGGFGEHIACEVTVNASYEFEFHNIQRTLAAGYDKVIAVSSNPKKLKGLRRYAQGEVKSELEEDRILFFLPAELISYLDQKRAKSATREKKMKMKIRGYNVIVRYRPISEEEEKDKMAAIARILLKTAQKENQG